MTEFEKNVYEYLQTVPDGKVVTYKQVAIGIGNPKAARAVGNALHNNPDTDKYPCFKVVSAKGKLANNFSLGIEVQKKRLKESGVQVSNYSVNLKKYQME